ncbi:hypothetical protein ACFVGV_06255 [Pseudarthrobacter scleromae]|uniref:hypothetical protein n=1 Tax=Pseudarthrobacter scleromae TaxID=158897 RepID=UPI00363317DD
MADGRSDGKTGHELYEIVLAVEELLGDQLSGEELRELVNAADPAPKPEGEAP